MTAQKLMECIEKLKHIPSGIFTAEKKTAQLFSQQVFNFMRLEETELTCNEKAILLMECSQYKVLTTSSRDFVRNNGKSELQPYSHHVNLAMTETLKLLSTEGDPAFIQELLQEKNNKDLTLGQCILKYQKGDCIEAYKKLTTTHSTENLSRVVNSYDPPILGHNYQLEIHHEHYAPATMVSQPMRSIGAAAASSENAARPSLLSKDEMELMAMHKNIYPENTAR